MTRIGRRFGVRLNVAPGLAIALIVGVGIGLAWPSPSEAARLTRFLTPKDVAGRLVLDQNGEHFQLSAGDRHLEIAQGSTPTYLAIPLHGGEHLPASIPTLETGAQEGENPVGPLNFDTLVKANLDTTLATSRLAVVDTPSQNYLVEFLPRRAHSGSITGKAAGTATSTVDELTHLLNTGSTQLTKLTQSGMDDLEKFLHISSKTSTTAPKLNLEAQVLTGDVQPAAIPEPSTWMVFIGLLAGGAVLRRRLPGQV